MSLMNKIENLIKREKLTPERVTKDDSKKSSTEILSELFGVFNAPPPKLEDLSSKKSKKSKRKHKKEKKKRSHSGSSDSDDSEYSHKHKKRKKAKSRKRHSSGSVTPPRSSTPIKSPPFKSKIKVESNETDHSANKIKTEFPAAEVKKEDEKSRRVSFSNNDAKISITFDSVEASLIPMPQSPDSTKMDVKDSRKMENANTGENEKSKGKIQIKNLKFSAVFEEAVKKAEEEARKRAEKLEEGEYTDSSSSCEQKEDSNSQFPKTSDPSGMLKQQVVDEIKIVEEEKPSSKRSRHSDSHRKSSRRRSRERSRSRKRSRRSRSNSRRRRRSNSRTRLRSGPRRADSRPRQRSRLSPRHERRGRRSRSPTGVKLADSEKKRLLEVARRNAINMLKNGAVPAGAAALPPHTRNQVMAAIQSGGKSVDELTDFCKHLSKKEALGELSSVTSGDEMSENEDTLAFHHPFLVKEKAPIVMNIRGGAPLPVKNAPLAIVDKDELRMQFPVSSGSQHREKATEWVPVSPPRKDMQVAKLNHKSHTKSTSTSSKSEKSSMLALPAPPAASPPPYMKSFTSGDQLSSVVVRPAPGPQAYPPGIQPPPDIGSLVSEKLLAIRKEQEEFESFAHGLGWSTTPKTKSDRSLGQFTGTTGANILTPRELASGTQAWAKKDQLVRAAPVEGGMGMHLLQKMGWTPGQGLGKEGTGTLQPLLLEVKLDTRGLQAKEEMRSHRGQGRRQGGGGGGSLAPGGKHPVSLLGEYCSKQKLGPPEYNLCFECGPDHKKNFLFRVKVAGVEYQPAVASANKKQAKADSATLALQKLGIAI